LNYYRRYSGDYLRDTARLNLTEHGAYTLLLDYYYTEEKPLPLDHGELHLMLRAMRPEDRKAVDKVLATYFTTEPDGYHNARADHEIEVSKTARNNGKGGGRPITETGTGSITGTVTGIETGHETGTLTGFGTGALTEEGGGSGHPPTTNHHPPTTNHQPRSKTRRPKAELQPLPDGWFPSQRTVDRLAAEFKFSNGDAERYLAAFRDACAAKAYRYKDFDAAFSNCVRQDWPKFRNGASAMPAHASSKPKASWS